MADRPVATRYDLTVEALAHLLEGEPAYRVEQVWDGLHRQGADPSALTVLPKALRARLAEQPALAPALREDEKVTADGGSTVKWLWALPDGRRIETVLMHHRSWSTVCVSTQAGCAMACAFCATGQAGFERNLSTGEIVEQVVRARSEAAVSVPPRRLSHVVFMGMGEPLANYERTWAAVERLHGALGLSARSLTISTVGVAPGIRRLAGEDLPVNLAVSLHAADDALRDTLVPLNRRYPIAEVVAACEEYVAATRRRISFEWALIDGVNDRPADSARLAGLARQVRAHVNLIPLNPTPGYPVQGTPSAGVARFRDDLRALGVPVTVRRTRGVDIDAACGQLRAGAAARTAAGLPD